MKFTIPCIPMTANTYARSHWAVQRAQVKRWHKAILLLAPGTGLRPIWKAHVTINVYRQRLQDRDNLVASMKAILDALKKCRWIVDDSNEWLELVVWEHKCKRKEQHTNFEILYEKYAARGKAGGLA